jgi:hypothetical protein
MAGSAGASATADLAQQAEQPEQPEQAEMVDPRLLLACQLCLCDAQPAGPRLHTCDHTFCRMCTRRYLTMRRQQQAAGAAQSESAIFSPHAGRQTECGDGQPATLRDGCPFCSARVVAERRFVCAACRVRGPETSNGPALALLALLDAAALLDHFSDAHRWRPFAPACAAPV